MDAIVAALAEQQAELLGLLADLDEADWQRPSRCEGWTVADVVLHVAQTNEMAIASARGRVADYMMEVGRNVGPATSVDDGADLMVALERGAPGAAIRDRYRAAADELHDLLAASDPHLRVEWVAGQLSARTVGHDAPGRDVDPHRRRRRSARRRARARAPAAPHRPLGVAHDPYAFARRSRAARAGRVRVARAERRRGTSSRTTAR